MLPVLVFFLSLLADRTLGDKHCSNLWRSWKTNLSAVFVGVYRILYMERLLESRGLGTSFHRSYSILQIVNLSICSSQVFFEMLLRMLLAASPLVE